MLIMLNEKTVYSTLYGMDGSKELVALRKRFRLGREFLMNEGHPVDEHLLVVQAKLPTLRQITTSVTKGEFSEVQAAKRNKLSAKLSNPPPKDHISPVSPEEVISTPRRRRPERRPRHRLTEETLL